MPTIATPAVAKFVNIKRLSGVKPLGPNCLTAVFI